MRSYVLFHVRDTWKESSMVLSPKTLSSDTKSLPCICTVLLEPGRSPAQNLTYDLHESINKMSVIPEPLVNLVEVACGNCCSVMPAGLLEE